MQYKITNVNRRNEWTGRDGQQMVDWAIALEGDDQGWIKLTQKVDTKPPEIGQTISGSIENKTDKNGNDYRKFTKEYKGGGSSGGGFTEEDRQQLNFAVMMLEELSGRRDEHTDSSVNVPDDDPFGGL